MRIGDIADVKGGKRLPKGEELTSLPTDNPYIRAQDIREGKIRIEDPKFLTPEQHQRLKRYVVAAGDVCIVIVGANVGDVGIVPEHLHGANLTENAVKLTDFRLDCVPRYVNYCLSAPDAQAQMQQIAGGAAQPKLGIYKVLDVEIPFHPKYKQERIASILSAYDDLIENNTRRIRVLKEMARTIFCGTSVQNADSWNLVPIKEVYENLYDGPHATPKPSSTGPIYLGIQNVTEQGELDLTNIRHIAEEDFSQWTRRVLPRTGDIVFTYEATLNRYAIINRDFRGCLGRRMALIRPNDKCIDPYLFLHCLLSDQWREEVRSKIISGATVDRIPLITFPTFKLNVPGRDVQARIAPAIRACEELAFGTREK